MKSKKNKRCPLQAECEKKCEYEGREIDCVYYFANGIGDSVEGISEKTGLSKTTVRRRLKIAELDHEMLKKVSARQVSLADFDKLSQIDDIGKRNEVLSEIGTANFERAFKSAIDAQSTKKAEDEWRAVLSAKGLREIDYSDTFSGKYHSCQKTFCSLGTVSAEEYRLCGDEQYFAFGYKTVYFRRDSNAEDNKKAVESERKAAIEREKKDRLAEATKRAFLLRRDFIFGVSEADAKKNAGTIIEYDVRLEWESALHNGYYSYMGYVHSNFTEQADTKPDYPAVAEEVQNSPFRSLLRHVYAKWSDSEKLGFFDWNGKWTDNARLSLIYGFLMKIGYAMSDEEKELRDGTSKLFDDNAEAMNTESERKEEEKASTDARCGGDCDDCGNRERCPLRLTVISSRL